MKYTDAEIKYHITEFINDFNEHDLYYVTSYCVGYFGVITLQIWNVITDLHREGIIK